MDIKSMVDTTEATAGSKITTIIITKTEVDIKNTTIMVLLINMFLVIQKVSNNSNINLKIME